MAEITAALVKELREKTGAGMMDCKKALSESDADVEAAVDWLRKNGLAAAAKKAGRVAAEGLVGVAMAERAAALVEINAETDFVARNETFQGFVADVAAIALDVGADVAAIGAAAMPGGGTVAERLTQLVATIGENISLRRAASLTVEPGVVASYVHAAAAPGMGRIGVLVALRSTGDGGKLAAFGRQLAMHIAAASPQWVAIDDVEPAVLERERTVLAEQARASGRPENIIEKMVEGRLRKFYEDVVLLEQSYVIDTDAKVAKAIEAVAADLGAPVEIAGFVRYALGEGIEKNETDFAAEVAATLGKD
jgi:elongation factor Ts